MAWEWGHSPEGYQNVRANIEGLPLPKLLEIVAEWEATESYVDDPLNSPELNEVKYNKAIKRLRAEDRESKDRGVHFRTRRERLADIIWEHASTLRTCTNGGHEAWLCPYGCGCHMASFSKKGEL